MSDIDRNAGGLPMKWSLSEFLNLIELRGQTWCQVDVAEGGGFKIPHNEAVYFYAVLEGAAEIAGASGFTMEMRAGDLVMVISGEAHALRTQRRCVASSLEFLETGEYADAPPALTVGEGRRSVRLLAGRLKVRWPAGQHPRDIPAVLAARASESVINIPLLLEKASGVGANAMLTQAATLMFVTCFRDDPQCRAVFQDFNRYDPISRAQQYIEKHPFGPWTVENLARKVGMGRSNFAARFAREAGRTPKEYLSAVRMEHAAMLLENTDMKIAEVGERVGYRSEAAFIRRFTTAFGASPGELRRQRRSAAQPRPTLPRNTASVVSREPIPA